MNDFHLEIAALSPEQKVLFDKLLKQSGLSHVKTSEISKIAIPKRKDSDNIPLSFAQQRLWFFQQLNPDNGAYNVISALRLKGQLKVTLLEKVFTEIVRRHESLRTTFITNSGGQPIQVIASPQPLTLPIVDLTEASNVEQEVERIAIAQAQRSFDLTKPLLRITLLKLGETDHILLLTMHHIISDRWSLGVFVSEMKALYEAFSNERLSPLPELPIQYADWAIWQQQYLQGEVLEAQMNYWKQQLTNLPVLELPTDRPRPAVATYKGATQYFELSKALTDALKALSAKEGVTLFTLILTVFKVLLHKYTHQNDIVVGTDIANRNRVETEGLIGFLINTLVLRTNLSDNPTFRQLLNRVREITLKAYDYQDIPFDKLVDILKPERNLSDMVPLYQVKFDLQLAQVEPLELSGLIVSPLGIDNGTTKFELRFNLSETPQGLTGLVEYSTDLFETHTITRMVKHFQNLLEVIVANPQQHLSELSLLMESERHQLTVEWNDTEVEYPQHQCIHHLFEAQAERTPDAIAVVFEDQHLTYRELNAKANQLAHYLRSLELQPEVLVGICVERSLNMVIGLLGILKAGGAYVPLDPSYPSERLSFMLANSQPKVLLTQQHLLKNLPTHQAKLVCIDTEWEIIAQQSTQNLTTNITVDYLAYVIYTSGSTGQPKGAMNTHRGICNRLLWMQDAYQLTTTDRVLQKTPFSFDVSVWEFFWPLITGARLVVAKPEGHRDPNYLVSVIAHQQITTIHFVPSMLQAFVEAEGLEKCHSLKRVMASGEALPVQLQQRFFQRLSAQLHNLYGPTEASVDVTFWECKKQSSTQEDRVYQNTVPIGHPIANIQIYLLDKSFNPVPVGVTGEVYIGGVGVGRGYFYRPELTAEKFIPNPFSHQSGTRLYKTGDLARYLPNGAIEYVGRIDHQVKVRGFRIELGEIEAALFQHPAVRKTAVVVREDVVDYQDLVTYVVPQKGQTLTITELRQFLELKLPNYMIPTAFVLLEDLPLTPNGKVDRKALKVPDTARPDLEAVYQPPQTEVEKTIAHLWQEFLKVENVGINDNFFELGGQSLLLVQVHSQLQKIFQRDFPLVEMFQYPTISRLARYLSQKSSEETSVIKDSHLSASRTASVQRRKQARKEHRTATKEKGVSSQ
jgi:amino acid adenylation domain-containing protein